MGGYSLVNLKTMLFISNYAIQINIPLFNMVKVSINETELLSIEATIIPSNIEHKLYSGLPFLLLLINPLEIPISKENYINI